MNVVNEELLDHLRKLIEEVQQDPEIRAIVLRSDKENSFGAGADVDWLPSLAVRSDAEEFLAGVHRLMNTLVESEKPLVTVLNGRALGGALELALASRAIVATPDAEVAMPEVTLELLPGGGGTQLLPRFLPVDVAAEMLATGRFVDAQEGHRLGLLDEVVDSGNVLSVAMEVAKNRAAIAPPTPECHQESALASLDRVRETLRQSKGGLSTAAARILDVMAIGVAEGIEAGLEAERRGFLTQLRSSEAQAAIHIFRAKASNRRRNRSDSSSRPVIGVIGAGQMGSGIAATAATRDLRVIVRDISEQALERSKAYLERVLERTVEAELHDDIRNAWTTTTRWSEFRRADVAIEAVFEEPNLKREVLETVSRIAPRGALIATNTSAIPIERLARAVAVPEHFLGMHFFSPVERMPLIELIPHSKTESEIVQRAAAVATLLGKYSIIAGDAPGFFASRVYARWLIEGIRLLLDGVPIRQIDESARRAGFPVGPLQAHDEATIELVLQASIVQVAQPVMGSRLDVDSVRSALESLLASDIRGRRFGVGFYRYGRDSRREMDNEMVPRILGIDEVAVPDDVVEERLLLAFASESYISWDDGILCHPDDGDLASVLGLGFPASKGGPFHFADRVGAEEIIQRCEALSVLEFPPGLTTQAMAKDRTNYSDLERREFPKLDLRV